jgi:hypothetical protein
MLENVNLKTFGRRESPTMTSSYNFYDLDPQPTHLLGGTLKYLYLIFAEDNVLPLDKWIFNAVGQPLPIFNKAKDF